MVALGLLLSACPASTNTSSVTLYDYVCANGTPADGGATEENSTRCASCNSGFILTAAQTCVKYAYVCENGTPVGDDATADNITKCTECASGFKLHNEQCVATKHTCTGGTPSTGKPSAGNQDVESCQSCSSGFIITAAHTCSHRYICNNGTPTDNTDATGDNVTQCASCTSGYLLTATNSCTNDLDGDGVLNTTDVDDDNDGLIEVPDLTALHNMRYNLAGTSYKTQSSGTGSTAGAPTASNKAADYACSSMAGLCGYELTQNLTFDKDGDGKTFEAKSGGGYTLDSGDNASPYFVVANDGSGGWLPIGSQANPFAAIFEGNGYTISHMAISRNQTYVGMFGFTSTGTSIRNLGLLNALADYSGNDLSNKYVGGLVGLSSSTIRNSYADVMADAGPGNGDVIGGLVGRQTTGAVIASYATGVVDSVNAEAGTAGDQAGGLIGSIENSTVIASYATGRVENGGGNTSDVGGLIGIQARTSVIASYATGSVHYDGTGNLTKIGGLVGSQTGTSTIIASYTTGNVHGGNLNDRVGGLVGNQAGGTIIASYATGNVDGGTGAADNVGKLIGLRSGGSHAASYGFGTASNVDTVGINGTTLQGVSSAAGLNSANTVTSGTCIGIANSLAYTTSDTCTATTKTACSWSLGACSGNVIGIDCSVFTSSSTCTATTGKPAGTWTTNVWNNAAAGTAGAWDFGTSSQAPALKYADFDGSGSNYNCNQFLTGKCNTLIPGQR